MTSQNTQFGTMIKTEEHTKAVPMNSMTIKRPVKGVVAEKETSERLLARFMAQQDDGSGACRHRPTNNVSYEWCCSNAKTGWFWVAFGDILRRTFGPNGLGKMMYKTNGENAITNDGAKIVADLLVKHPVAKAFVQLPESQENGWRWRNRVSPLASELMKEAGRLLERGVHPLALVEAYQQSMQYTLDVSMSGR